MEEGCAVVGDAAAGGCDAEMAAAMGGFDGPADGYAVAFGNHINERELEIGEGSDIGFVEGFETGWADEYGVGVREAVRLALGAEHFIDGGGVFLIPDFFKPAADQMFVGFRHK